MPPASILLSAKNGITQLFIAKVDRMFSSRTNWRMDPNRFTQALEEHRRSGRELLDLTVSNPTACGLAYPEREIVAALADRRALEYCPDSKGLREAREAIA